jgi:hypothetical protein
MATARQLPCGAKFVVAALLAVAFAFGSPSRVLNRSSNLSADRAAVERDTARVYSEDHYLTGGEQR